MDDEQPKRDTEESSDEGVRLVGRAEAEAAISAGEVVTRRQPLGSQPRHDSPTMANASANDASPSATPVASFPLPTSSAPAQTLFTMNAPEEPESPSAQVPDDNDVDEPHDDPRNHGDSDDHVVPDDLPFEPTPYWLESDDVVDESSERHELVDEIDDEMPEQYVLGEQPPAEQSPVEQRSVEQDELFAGKGAVDNETVIEAHHLNEPDELSDPLPEELEVPTEEVMQRPPFSESSATATSVAPTASVAEPTPTAEQSHERRETTDSESAAKSSDKGSPSGNRFRTASAAAIAKDKTKAFRTPSFRERVLTAAVFAAAAFAAFSAGPAWALALASVVVFACAIELFDGLRRAGYRPATLLGLLAVVGTLIGAYTRGETALPLITVMLIAFCFLWFLIGVSKAPPTTNVAVTVLGYVWVGVLGSFAPLLLRMPDRTGMAFLLGAVLVTIAYDTGAYVGGNTIGKRLLAPSISPNKTWEGLMAGTICAVVVGGLLVSLISPWGFVSGLCLGLVVSAVAPLGDLAESMVKRDLGIKDMGRLLPGHGGLLDRFDALLLVLPVTYYLVHLFDLVP